MIHTLFPNQLVLGTFGPRLMRIPVGIPVDELTNHVHITGTTNSGKSRLLAHIALTLIGRGEGVTFIDPHGDTARLVLAHLVGSGVYHNPEAYRRISYLDIPAAAAVGRYLPFNILEQSFDTPTTARLVLEALRRAWPTLENGVAPAFENAVLSGVSVLCQHKLPIVLLHDLFTDAPWRSALLNDVTDPTVRGFFNRLERWGSREQAQYLESTLRRAFLLSFSPVLRFSLGQRENRLGSFRERMDHGQSLIVNLAVPDSDARRLLGSLLTVFMEQGARQRANGPVGERRQHTLILDEFADLSTQSGTAMQHILEECRKFGLGLVLANQSGSQLTERIKGALSNVGTTIVFRLGRRDAEEMARSIGTVQPTRVKHAGGERSFHPLYMPLAEQWEAWAGGIGHLRPRQTYVKRLPPTHPVKRRLHASVAKLRTPDLSDPMVDPGALAAVTDQYLTDCFPAWPLVQAELASLRPTPVKPMTKRRTKLATA
jgi:hypothetical protein